MKMPEKSIQELEEHTECKISHVHKCDEGDPPEDIYIYHITEASGIVHDQWMLFSLEWQPDYGKKMSGHSFLIHFCPFCGLRLD